MRARVLKNIDIGFSYVKGRVFDVHEVVGTRVTIKYAYEGNDHLWERDRYIDLALDEVELLMEGRHVEVYRNQATRDGNWIGYNKSKGYALRYAMPNGREFICLLYTSDAADE